MASQIRVFPQVLPTLGDLDARILYLYRDDTFATAMSYFKARTSSIYHADRSAPAMETLQVEASPDDFARIMEECRSDKRAIMELSKERQGILISYENMIAEWDDTIARIGNVLDIAELRVPMALSQMSAGHETVRVINQEELRRRFLER
jgi:LPS sulfotransferase NodH